MKHRLILLFSLLILSLFVAVPAQPAEAHADLIQSVPEANAQLDRSPVQVELFLSEPVEPSFTKIEVLDGSGNRVDNDDAAVDPLDPAHVTVSLRSLTDGVYTVSWRALSSVDSHITAGAFPFAVGDVDAAALEAAAQASQQIRLSPGEIAARWLTYLGAMVLAGGALFTLLIWEPAEAISGVSLAERPAWRTVTCVALLLLGLANITWLLIQAGQATGAEIAWPWNSAVSQVLFDTRFGALWIARFALALVLLRLALFGESRRERWLTFGTGALVLLSISLGSHAAAQPQALLPIAADLIHLLAGSFWVGGLIFFVTGLFALRRHPAGERVRLTAVLIPRFSALAILSVSSLVLTGLYASVLHVGSLADLTGTTYGRALVFKLALVLPMVMLGAVNLLVTTPRMKGAAAAGEDGERANMLVNRFRGLVTSEVTLGLTVLLSVAVLTTLPPAQVAAEAPMLNGEEAVDDLEIALDITPGRPGINTFVVTVTRDGQPLNDAREVALQFSPTTADLPPSSAQLSARGEGQYAIEGGFLALPDIWQVQVAVRRADAFDAFANFDFGVGAASGGAASFPWYQAAGALLLLAAAAFMFALQPYLRPRGRGQAIAFSAVPAVALVAVGLVVFGSPPGGQKGLPINPIAPNPDSLAIGGQLYAENCFPCHGESGAGDGPVGRTLNPPPADLTQHTIPGVHPDGRLFNWISKGVQGSVMPAFEERLSDEQRWHVVNYIRTLAQ